MQTKLDQLNVNYVQLGHLALRDPQIVLHAQLVSSHYQDQKNVLYVDMEQKMNTKDHRVVVSQRNQLDYL